MSPAGARRQQLAINGLKAQRPLDHGAVEQFVAEHTVPIIEGDRATFLFRGSADEVRVRHRVVGLPDPLSMRLLPGTDLWYATIDLPHRSRVEYQIETVRGGEYDRFNDPFNNRRARNPFGESSVCAASGYEVPSWAQHDDEARPGELVDLQVNSKALKRVVPVRVYLPARYQANVRHPLLVVHDGPDYLEYTHAKTVLDNLIHRLDVAPLVAAFIPPGDRLAEYPNHAPHARFVARELVPALAAECSVTESPSGRALMGSSFGGIASLSTAVRYPGLFGALILQSASMVFTDIGVDHGGGPAFDPVVKFMNAYRARPSAPVERIFQTCGIYEPLITPNRSMVSTFREAGITVRYTESRDGHNWENWRDSLRDALSWVFPGPQKFVYE